MGSLALFAYEVWFILISLVPLVDHYPCNIHTVLPVS
jgi:hypothetical protein